MKKKLVLLSVVVFLNSCSLNMLNGNLNKSDKGKDISQKEEKFLEHYKEVDINDLEIKSEIHKFKVKNGPTFILVRNNHLPIYSFNTFYKIGENLESGVKPGVAHLLEHLMYKGSNKYFAGEFERYIETHGGTLYAYTTEDMTVYSHNLVGGTLEKLLKMEKDRMLNLKFSQEEFDNEVKIIKEEKKNRRSPGMEELYVLMKQVIKKAPIKNAVNRMQNKIIETIKSDDVRQFYYNNYNSNQALVVIVGDFKIAKTTSLIKKVFLNIKSDNFAKRPKRKIRSKKIQYPRSIKFHGDSQTPLMGLVLKGDKWGSRNGLILDVLSRIIGNGNSSYFYQNLVNTRWPVLKSVISKNFKWKEGGMFTIQGSLLKGKSIKNAYKKVIKTMRKFCHHGISSREIQKSKNQIYMDYLDKLVTNVGLANFLAKREILLNDYKKYKKELRLYREISEKEVKQSCLSLFNRNNFHFITLWNRNPKRY